ncbi:DsrE family protein [Geoglobus sp.]
MKLGIVIYSNDVETVWNTYRFANFALKAGDEVKVFLLGKGVDCENMNDERFNLREQMEEFVKNGGKIYACGTCLKIRDSSPELCPVSMMEEYVRDGEEK